MPLRRWRTWYACLSSLSASSTTRNCRCCNVNPGVLRMCATSLRAKPCGAGVSKRATLALAPVSTVQGWRRARPRSCWRGSPASAPARRLRCSGVPSRRLRRRPGRPPGTAAGRQPPPETARQPSCCTPRVRSAHLLRQVVRRQHHKGAQPPDDPAAQRGYNGQGVGEGFAAAGGRVDAQVVRATPAVERAPDSGLHREEALNAGSAKRSRQTSVKRDAGGVKLVSLHVQRARVTHPRQRSGRASLARRGGGCWRRRWVPGVGVAVAAAVAIAIAAVVRSFARRRQLALRRRRGSALSSAHASPRRERPPLAARSAALLLLATTGGGPSLRPSDSAGSVHVFECAPPAPAPHEVPLSLVSAEPRESEASAAAPVQPFTLAPLLLA